MNLFQAFSKFGVLSAIVFSVNSASASFMESCEFEASVVSVNRLGVLGEQVSAVGAGEDTYVHVMNIQVTKVLGDISRMGCDRHVDQPFQIVIKSSDNFKAGDVVKLGYTYANSFTPQGVASMIRWEQLP